MLDFLSNEQDPINVDLIQDEADKEKCPIDHSADGFDSQEVYVWSGQFKGKFVRVKQMSGGLARVEFDSVI